MSDPHSEACGSVDCPCVVSMQEELLSVHRMWNEDVAKLAAARAENERLCEALRGLISCHGMAVNPGTQHAKCGYLSAAHAALAGPLSGSDADPT